MALQLWADVLANMPGTWWTAASHSLFDLPSNNLPSTYDHTSSANLDNPVPASCPNAQISCHNTSIVQDLCCFNAPGGQMLLTQFWDTHPSTGPVDKWTMHGLWPDKCDGSFETFCDSKRHYTNISEILAPNAELLQDMSTYWKDFKGQDSHLWNHEWNKHGTCISTLETRCYDNYMPQTEVADYFSTAMGLFKTLPTYEWLAEVGITPDREARYSLSKIQDVLEQHHGKPVTIKCRYGQLDEVWYHFDVQGSIQTGKFLPAHPDGPKGNCPAEGVRYMPKKAQRPSPTGSPPKPTGTRPAFSGRGYLTVKVGGQDRGC